MHEKLVAAKAAAHQEAKDIVPKIKKAVTSELETASKEFDAQINQAIKPDAK